MDYPYARKSNKYKFKHSVFELLSFASTNLAGQFHFMLLLLVQSTVVGGGEKNPWSSEQIEVNLSFLEAFGYILSRKVFLYTFKEWITPSNQLQKSEKCSKIRKFGNKVGL